MNNRKRRELETWGWMLLSTVVFGFFFYIAGYQSAESLYLPVVRKLRYGVLERDALKEQAKFNNFVIDECVNSYVRDTGKTLDLHLEKYLRNYYKEEGYKPKNQLKIEDFKGQTI